MNPTRLLPRPRLFVQRAKDDVLQKEVKVKILKDSIHLLVSRSPPSARDGGQQLTSELEGVLANYHKLCDRFKSKCHTLEVTWDGRALRSCCSSRRVKMPALVEQGKRRESLGFDVAFSFEPQVPLLCSLFNKKKKRRKKNSVTHIHYSDVTHGRPDFVRQTRSSPC